MTSLKEAMEYGIPFSFIITFATFSNDYIRINRVLYPGFA